LFQKGSERIQARLKENQARLKKESSKTQTRLKKDSSKTQKSLKEDSKKTKPKQIHQIQLTPPRNPLKIHHKTSKQLRTFPPTQFNQFSKITDQPTAIKPPQIWSCRVTINLISKQNISISELILIK
jgi:hypothetical protein